MKRSVLAAGALLAAAASLPLLVTAGAAASAPPSSPQASPWTDSSYQPKPGDWQPYVLAPSGHTVKPASVLAAYPRSGSITGNTSAVLGRGGTVRLTSTGGTSSSPLLIIDFGKEVAGNVSVQVTGASATRPTLHACFSESREERALSPTQNSGEAAYAPGCDTANIWNGYPGQPYTWDSDSHTLPLSGATLPGTVTDPTLRGGFRYLTLFLSSPGYVDIGAVSLNFTAAPLQQDPAAYQGWFLSSDNELNKIWYAGAYTVQIDTGMSDTAKSWPYTTGEADSYDSQIPYADPKQEVIFDGGKRDRDTWQGDLGVEAPVTYLSTDDTGAVNNSLSSLAAQQLPDGYVPAEGLVGAHNTGEETTYGEYVTWFVNNMAVHYLYTGDKAYLDTWYPALVKAMAWLAQQQDSSGLISFAASGSCGHYGYTDCGTETYINALYYRNLEQMATLATEEGKTSDAAAYTAQAATVKNAINSKLYDDTTGAYRLSEQTPDVYPQDANATAILAGVASQQQADRALAYLRGNDWSSYGSLDVSPSTPNSVISPVYEPLPSGFEATARLTGDDPDELGFDTGLQLTREFWGWMLGQDPGSTFWEKVSTDGTPQIGQFESLAHAWASAPDRHAHQPGAGCHADERRVRDVFGAVTSFANGPGTPYGSGYALDGASAAVAASAPKTVQVSPSKPLDLSEAKTFFAYVDGYGGAPGATGYQATITLTSGGGQTLTTTAPVSHDAWTPVDLDVSSWQYRNDVTGIAVSFAATGSTTTWSMHFQVDDVGWTG
jgi:hypothetical protein